MPPDERVICSDGPVTVTRVRLGEPVEPEPTGEPEAPPTLLPIKYDPREFVTIIAQHENCVSATNAAWDLVDRVCRRGAAAFPRSDWANRVYYAYAYPSWRSKQAIHVATLALRFAKEQNDAENRRYHAWVDNLPMSASEPPTGIPNVMLCDCGCGLYWWMDPTTRRKEWYR